MDHSKIKKVKNKINNQQEKLQKYIIEIASKEFAKMEERMREHTIKFSIKEKKFKKEYD